MEPIRHLLTVASSAAAAFEVFTTGMGGWWDAAYSPDPAAFTGIEVEPQVGGAVAMVLGETHLPFGAVTAWEPALRYAQTFWLAMDASHPSTIEVLFEDADSVCEVTFEHGGWTAENLDSRSRYGDWPHLLGRFATACAA